MAPPDDERMVALASALAMTARMPLPRAASMASAVSRKGRLTAALYVADDADFAAAEPEDVEFGMVAGPIAKWLGLARKPKPAHEIAVRVEDAHRRRLRRRDPFLSPELRVATPRG